jgi:hypothetical protein
MRGCRSRRRIGFALLALLLGELAWAQAGAPLAGRRLEDVLEELRTAGLALVYSTDLVRPEMKVRAEPRGREPRERLDEVLAPHGLVAEPGPAGTLVVVKRRKAAKPADAADPGAGLRLGFEDDAEVQQALPDPGPATLRLGSRDVLRTPGALDNVFRALSVMPGVTGAGLFESKIAVRGGAPDQNLTLMDGVEIHNPFRLFGAVAAFNPETVARFDLLAGAFPAQYGDRLASLLVVETRDGRRDRAFAGAAHASATDASLALEGRLPGPGDGAWLFASRRTYYDLVAERFVGEGLPSFDDLQLKLSWRTASGARLALTAWRSRESTDADWSDAADTVVVGSQGRNDLVALNVAFPFGRRVTLRGVASAYRFEESLVLDVAGYSDMRVSFDRRVPQGSLANANDQLLTLEMERATRVQDLALRQQLEIALSPRHRLDIGAELHELETSWQQTLPADRNPESANGSSMLFGAGLPDAIDSSFDGTRGAAFLQYQGRIGSRLSLTSGLRLERSGAGVSTALAPRLHTGLDLGRFGRLTAGAGVHHQSPGYEKLLHSDYFLDLSRELRPALGLERSLDFVLGYALGLGASSNLSLEGYYRDFSNLVIGRQESEAERAARLATYDYPANLAWGLPSAPIITSRPVGGASGRAYGLLASVTRGERPGRRLSGWLAYAWGRAERTAYGRTYPFDYDRPHALTAVAAWRFSKRFELGVTARVASGLPTTPPRGVYVLGAPDVNDVDRDGNRDELRPARDGALRPIYVVDPGDASTLHTIRLPTYARLDARLTFAPRGPQGRWLFYVEAINVTDRENAASYDWDIRLDPGAERPHVVLREGQDGIPFLPTLGVRVRF